MYMVTFSSHAWSRFLYNFKEVFMSSGRENCKLWYMKSSNYTLHSLSVGILAGAVGFFGTIPVCH